jgi:hypothetical protein
VQEILGKSPTIDYVAEFFVDTVDKLKKFMGPSDVEIAALVDAEKNQDFVKKVKINRVLHLRY